MSARAPEGEERPLRPRDREDDAEDDRVLDEPGDGGRVPVGDVLVRLAGGRPAPVAEEDERRDEDQPAGETALVDDPAHAFSLRTEPRRLRFPGTPSA